MNFRHFLLFSSKSMTLSLLFAGTVFAAAPVDPEAATGVVKKQRVDSVGAMVVSANPLATEAGMSMLAAGGSATDAAIAVQLVLGLVEPQSSGIGGGLFFLHYDKIKQQLRTLDGRETAPAAAHPDWFLHNNQVMDWRQAYIGGKSVGTPGVIMALWDAHQQWGVLPWEQLFEPAIRLADQGFVVSARLAKLLVAYEQGGLSHFSQSRDYFYPQGTALKAGDLKKNPAYAKLLKQIAKQGPQAFYQGEHAKAIVDTVNQAGTNPGQMVLADIENYQVVERDPLCQMYRKFRICSMAPPSSGGITVLQILGILQHFELSNLDANSLAAVHLIAQASRLAFADRERYIADPAFAKVPVQALLSTDYLKQRAKLIDLQKDAKEVIAGEPVGVPALQSAVSPEFENTSHFSIVDHQGNAVSVTTSIENAFGSGLMVQGYLLNNQLTDFSFVGTKNQLLVANRVEAGKRPRSSMAPMMVFDSAGQLRMLVGSPGGSRIINYVAQALIAMIDWELDPQQAADLAKFSHRNDSLVIEKGTELERFADKLREMGYEVRISDLNSGLHLIKKSDGVWQGGADPRREGTAAGTPISIPNGFQDSRRRRVSEAPGA